MSTDRYTSPLSERYASKEMQYIFSQDMKFKTWRRLWIALAETEMELGLSENGKPVITQEQIDELKAHVDDINYDVAREREKLVRHVQKHFSKIFLSFVCPTVHIDHVGHRLKREKGNTDRQTDVRNRKSRPEHRIHALRKKACIFKDHQKCEIQDHRHTDDPFLLILKPFDPKCK